MNHTTFLPFFIIPSTCAFHFSLLSHSYPLYLLHSLRVSGIISIASNPQKKPLFFNSHGSRNLSSKGNNAYAAIKWNHCKCKTNRKIVQTTADKHIPHHTKTEIERWKNIVVSAEGKKGCMSQTRHREKICRINNETKMALKVLGIGWSGKPMWTAAFWHLPLFLFIVVWLEFDEWIRYVRNVCRFIGP